MAEVVYTVETPTGPNPQETVRLQIVKTNSITHEAVYDPSETDELYTHFTIDVNCVFNRFATASNQQRDPNGFVLNPGDDPMASVAKLRQLLLTPRGNLNVSIGGLSIVSVPRAFILAAQQPTKFDCKNGPKPVRCNVIGVHGTKSLIVNYVIETWLQEADAYNAGALLSNRWELSQSVDQETWLTTKTVDGVAIFRSDVLRFDDAQADDFRSKFGHPLAPNMRRGNILIKQEADGLQLRYHFEDVEQVLNLIPRKGIIKCKASDEYGINWHNFGLPEFSLNTWTYARNVAAVLPTFRARRNVEVWGMRHTTRRILAARTLNALAAFLPPFAFARGFLAPYTETNIEVDFDERHARGSVDYLGQGFVGGIGAMAFDPIRQLVTGNQTTQWLENLPDFGDTGSRLNVAPPGSNGMRGTFLERMISQALTSPGVATPNPPSSQAPSDEVSP
jgi:hypothetical protein